MSLSRRSRRNAMLTDRLKPAGVRFALLALCAVLVGAGRAPAQDHDHADEALEHPVEEALEAHGGDGHGHEDEAHGAAGHGGEGHVDYNQPPLDVHIPLLVWSLIVFGVFLLVAKKLAWRPLIDGLDARESRVNRALAEAEAARVDAKKLLDDHKAHLDQVTEQVKEIIAKARVEAEQEKMRIVSEAETEATAMRDQAIADIHAAREEALAGLDERIDSQVELASRHVLG